MVSCGKLMLTKKSLSGWVICKRQGGANTVFLITFLKLAAACGLKYGLCGAEGGQKASSVGRQAEGSACEVLRSCHVMSNAVWPELQLPAL